jgi:hypothetical protein
MLIGMLTFLDEKLYAKWVSMTSMAEAAIMI